MAFFLFRAPFPDIATVVVMPRPELRDAEIPETRVQLKTAMDGTLRTHVIKQPNRTTYKWIFDLSRKKGLELWEFIRIHAANPWEIVRDSDSIIVNLKVNPVELEMLKRAVHCTSKDNVNLTLEFEKIQ